MAEQYTNNAQTTLNGAILNTDLSLTVTSATAFPATGTFRILIDTEILIVTAVAGSVFTVTRAGESTAAAGHSNGATVTAILTAAQLTALLASGGPLGTPSSGTLNSAILGSGAAYLQYREQQAQNTSGGTFTSGAWRTRVLNTEVSDVGGYGTLASNQITLAAGTYYIRATTPAFAVEVHQTRLQNVTDGSTVLTGTPGYTASGVGAVAVTHSFVSGIFTIAASKALELQHQCSSTKTTNGFGVAANFTTEVYTVVELWKIG